MIPAIIIEDEPHCTERLIRLLTAHCKDIVKIAGHFSSAAAGIKGIQKLQPALVFLDVQLQNVNAFEMLQQIPDRNFDIIFTTAHDKYAVQAFKFCAIDYLLKPIEVNALVNAVSKLASKKPADETARKVAILLENLEQLKQYTAPKKIIVPTISGFEVLLVVDIIRCQSEVNYTTIFLKSKQKLVVAKTLKEFEEMLEAYNFFRIHNSHLVNLAYIRSYNKGKGGSVTLTDGSEIEVSTRRKEDFIQRMASL
jgi:two-component system, LytTR family, response regulator